MLRFFGYLGYLSLHILIGTWNVVRSALSKDGCGTPCIVELPLRCVSDLEVSMLASSITITPGTLVLGVAAGQPATPPSFFVHSLYDNNVESVLRGLRALEDKVLGVTRKTGAA